MSLVYDSLGIGVDKFDKFNDAFSSFSLLFNQQHLTLTYGSMWHALCQVAPGLVLLEFCSLPHHGPRWRFGGTAIQPCLR